MLVQWKRCNLAIACLSEHTNHKTCHTSARIPLTSLVPADFLCCGAVRGQQRHTDIHTYTQTPVFVHSHNYEHTYIYTLLRRGHHAGFGFNHRTLDISVCVMMFVHISYKNRTACLQICPCFCGFACNLITHISNAVFQHMHQLMFIFTRWR